MNETVYELRITRLINGWLIREDNYNRDSIGRAWVAMTEDQLAAVVREYARSSQRARTATNAAGLDALSKGERL